MEWEMERVPASECIQRSMEDRPGERDSHSLSPLVYVSSGSISVSYFELMEMYGGAGGVGGGDGD